MMYGEGSIKKPLAEIQLAKADQAGGLELGETAVITIRGKVTEMAAPRESISYGPTGGKAKMMPGCVTIEIEEISVSQKEDV